MPGLRISVGPLDLEDQFSDLGENLFQNIDFFFFFLGVIAIYHMSLKLLIHLSNVCEML